METNSRMLSLLMISKILFRALSLMQSWKRCAGQWGAGEGRAAHSSAVIPMVPRLPQLTPPIVSGGPSHLAPQAFFSYLPLQMAFVPRNPDGPGQIRRFSHPDSNLTLPETNLAWSCQKWKTSVSSLGASRGLAHLRRRGR